MSVASSTNIIESSLATLRRHLEMDVAFVGRVHSGRRYFEFVDAESSDCPVQPGESDPLEDTYCGRVIAGQIPQLVPDAAAIPELAQLPVTHELPVGAHMSVPLLRSSGEVLGTLCCFSYQPDLSLRERDLQMLKLFAEIVSANLESLVDADEKREATIEHIAGIIESGGPMMAMQPIVDLSSGAVRGFEALARFPAGTGWSPQEWFEQAETVGLGVALEASAVRSALEVFPHLPDATLMSVNVSEAGLRDPGILAMLTGPEAPRLVVELTEHSRVHDYGILSGELATIRGAGARLAVDDAGSGWAGLEHILRLQPEVLKLDRVLVHDIAAHLGRQAMVEALLGFSGRMGATLIAEGVETEEDLKTLRALGVVYAQGYVVGKPSLSYAEAHVASRA